jgi:hypothetical protein
MNAKRFRTNRHRLYVPLGFLLGLVVIAGLALTIARPVLGADDVAPSCTAPPLGMVGWWPGDGNAKDITPHDHDGTFTDDNVFVQGEVGQAFLFDGTDDYVDVPNQPDLTPASITVDAWINPAGFTGTPPFPPSIVNKGNVGNFAESYALFLDPNTHLLGFLVNTNGSSDGSGRDLVYGTTPIPVGTNTWTFVAGTYDGKSVHVYVNGVLDDGPRFGTATGPIHATANDLLIGKADRTSTRSPYPDSYFEGKIDEVELFSRALSGSEIVAINSAATAGKCKCQEKPDEADGDIQNDDTSKSHVKMTAKRNCDDNGEVDYTDDRGEEMKGKNKSVATSGNTAMVNGQGNLLDGTPVYYTIVMVGNQPIGMNLFSITWTTPAGTFFHKAGVMMPTGLISVPLP